MFPSTVRGSSGFGIGEGDVFFLLYLFAADILCWEQTFSGEELIKDV